MRRNAEIARRGDFLVIKNPPGGWLSVHISQVIVGKIDGETFVKVHGTESIMLPKNERNSQEEIFDYLVGIISGEKDGDMRSACEEAK